MKWNHTTWASKTEIGPENWSRICTAHPRSLTLQSINIVAICTDILFVIISYILLISILGSTWKHPHCHMLQHKFSFIALSLIITIANLETGKMNVVLVVVLTTTSTSKTKTRVRENGWPKGGKELVFRM